MPRLEWHVIAPTSRIAPLCHSVLRLEPYDTCELACTYCYARWYRGPPRPPRPLGGEEVFLREVSRVQRDTGLLFPVRMATLSDPFQPAEARWRRSLKLLRLASRLGVPVVLNTRVPPPDRRYWRALEELASQGLLLFQVTVTGTDAAWPLLRRLEPFSPPPGERLALARSAASRGIPVVVRVQPLIPGVTDGEAVLEGAARSGARGAIVEYLRAEKPLIERLPAPNLHAERVEWEEYAAESGILHPGTAYRLRTGRRLRDAARRLGLAFQTCKEGLFHLHEPARLDCCGYYLLPGRVSRKPTLWDVYLAARELGSLPGDRALEEACRLSPWRGTLLCGDILEQLPRWLARPLRLHLERTRRVLKRPALLSRVAPSLYTDGERVYAFDWA